MTIGTVTLVLGGATASMFASLVGRMWYHDRRLSRSASMALEDTGGQPTRPLTTSRMTNEHQGQNRGYRGAGPEEFGDSVMTRLDEHDLRVIEGSLTARNTTDTLERGASSFQDQVGDLLSAIGDNRARAEKSRETLDSVASSINRMASTVDGFSYLAEALGNIQEAVSDSRDEISTIDESVSIIIETMNIPSGGRA